MPYATQKHGLVITQIPPHLDPTFGGDCSEVLSYTDRLYDQVLATRQETGLGFIKLIEVEATQIRHNFATPWVVHNCKIVVLNALIEKPLQEFLDNLKWMRANLGKLDGTQSICGYVEDLLYPCVGHGAITDYLFESWPNVWIDIKRNRPSLGFPVGGSIEYWEDEEEKSFWRNPKRIELLEYMIEQLENHPQEVLEKTKWNFDTHKTFWSRGYE